MYSNEKFGKVQSGNFTHFRPPGGIFNDFLGFLKKNIFESFENLSKCEKSGKFEFFSYQDIT